MSGNNGERNWRSRVLKDKNRIRISSNSGTLGPEGFGVSFLGLLHRVRSNSPGGGAPEGGGGNPHKCLARHLAVWATGKPV